MGKKCSTCKVKKPFTEFYVDRKRKDNRQTTCIKCMKAQNNPPVMNGTIVCNKCGKRKNVSEFYTHKYMKNGRLKTCKDCVKNRRGKLNYKPRIRGYKVCPSCGENKQVSDFYARKTNKDGLKCYCKKCQYKEYVERKNKINYVPAKKTKVCIRCGLRKEISKFTKNRYNKSGLQSWCKKCCRSTM